MKKTTLALAIAVAAAVSTPALAQDYQMEAGLSYANVKPDFSGAKTNSEIGLDFKYHFDKVSTANRPLNEAAFLGHNSNVGINYARYDDKNWDEKDDTLGLNAEVWFDSFYAAADVSNYKSDAAGTDDETDYNVKVGYMFQQGLLAYLGVENGDTYEKAMIHLGTKYVADLGGKFVNLQADVANGDEDINGDAFTVVSLAGDYYFTNSISAGLTYAKSNAEGDDDAMMGVRGKYFITPMVSAEVSYTTQKDNEDTTSLRVAARF